MSAIDVDFNEENVGTINCCIITDLANKIFRLVGSYRIVHCFSMNKSSINTPFLS